MSRDWTAEELAAVSAAMKAAGHLSCDEFCEELRRNGFEVKETPSADAGVLLQRPLSTEGV